MKHVYSSASQVGHLFFSQYNVDGGRRAHVPVDARSGNLQYEPLFQYKWNMGAMSLGLRKKLDLTDASVLVSYRTPIMIILPRHKMIIATSTGHSSFTSRHTPQRQWFPHRDTGRWVFFNAALEEHIGVDTICEYKDVDNPHRCTAAESKLKKRDIDTMSFIDGRGFSTFSGPVQWRMEVQHRAINARKKALRARTAFIIEQHRNTERQAYEDAVLICSRFGLKSLPPMPSDEDVLVHMKEQAKKCKVADAKMKREADKRRVEKRAADLVMRADWIAGTRDQLSWSADNCELGTLLRVRGDVVQTSNGTSVPLIGARRAWPVLQRWRDSLADDVTSVVEATNPPDSMTLLFNKFFTPFRFQYLTKHELRVGCTVIPWSEIERIAPEVMTAAPVAEPA